MVDEATEPERQTQWLRGVLDLLVLATLERRGSTYGYALLRDLEDQGVFVKGGTLYPLLTRLEQDGLVISTWRPGEGGPGRKWFEATLRGRRMLAVQSRGWQRFSRTVDQILPRQATGRTTA